MSNTQLIEIPFSNTNPTAWRITDPGLCVEGRCLNEKARCCAYKQMVIGNLHMGKFNISRMFNFECPMCGGKARAEKFGLNRCEWRVLNTNRWSTVGDVYQSYNLSQYPIRIETRSVNINDDIHDDCVICLAAMDRKSKCSILPCKHSFHTECIHGWINTEELASLQCPICRSPIFA